MRGQAFNPGNIEHHSETELDNIISDICINNSHDNIPSLYTLIDGEIQNL
jgi:hypothetical protein